MNPRHAVTITKAELALLPPVTFRGKITVVETQEAAAEAVSAIMKLPVVGFDTETRPTFRKGHPNNVALMQVSADDRCWLFRINKLGVTQEMKRFLESDATMKIGLSLKDDFFVMHRNHDFTPAGFVDLQDIVGGYGIADTSLQKIYAVLFDSRISKAQRLSNWEAKTLTVAQQSYAAIDAWACLKIHRHLTGGLFIPEESRYYRLIEDPAGRERKDTPQS